MPLGTTSVVCSSIFDQSKFEKTEETFYRLTMGAVLLHQNISYQDLVIISYPHSMCLEFNFVSPYIPKYLIVALPSLRNLRS